MQKLFALMHARNMEFIRDKGTLFWNLVFPIFLVFGFAFAFSGGDDALFKVGIIGGPENPDVFPGISSVDLVSYDETDLALNKLRHHQIDMVVDYGEREYYVNEESSKGEVAETLFLAGGAPGFERRAVSGEPIRYVDWFVPGVIGMNMMFSCIFGVGWIIVRYRKNGVLKRLKATPVRAVEFVSAQLISRLYIVLLTAAVVYTGSNFFLKFMMQGSYLNLLLVTAIATVCMISFGLVFAARIKSEELANGLMNVALWPMMAFSGIFFSLEGTPLALQKIARAFPLTHYVEASRAIMLDGATLGEIMPNLIVLVGLTALFLLVSSLTFKWE
ncbi:MAG: ABC transporter permease [Spirochaetaceae bacterium]|nr:ABC transporter permease [Spirochaetaceae bacterium]MDT8297545.1 ABC transporter permease [Spirochaetaceae bacterium]